MDNKTQFLDSGITNPQNAYLYAANITVTILDGLENPKSYDLASFRKSVITFGRGEENDIVLHSPVVSREHGRFMYTSGGYWIMEDKSNYSAKGSSNGLQYNNKNFAYRYICEGDYIRIDKSRSAHVAEGVLFVISGSDKGSRWMTYPLQGGMVTIGRSPDNSIMLPHVSVSKLHASISYNGQGYVITDAGSTNGVILNGQRLRGSAMLGEKDVIVITNSKLIFTSTAIFYCYSKNGISVDTNHVVIRRGKGKKSFITSNDVSVNIRPGELVAVIGGSGAGKSTILNCMCGYLPPSSGDVYINGVNLYQNFDSLKKLIGYVPQSDIVYDNLTLHDMLMYTAKLRLPKDTSPEEQEAAIAKAIHLVELDEKADSYIRALSGGQRKRASIAVELLSDPNLLFLDEPASGLDPGTERNLMQSLREMADNGKTVILVTHSTLQLAMCDKILFMGKGGNLCFFGSLNEALKFFQVNDVVDVYNMITENAPGWRAAYDQISNTQPAEIKEAPDMSSAKGKERAQLPVLFARYFKLVVGDRQRLLLLLIQAPLLAFLISIVANGDQFDLKEATKSLLFALSCSAFWVGMLNAIQEVCKERSILKREYMTGLSLTSYLLSKIFVLGFLCLVQSFLIVGVFSILVGLPSSGCLFEGAPFIELLITTFLTALSSAAMGLFVSSMFTNADRAMTVAPILLMPQILFSGLIFKLEDLKKTISILAICRWSMEGYGTTADLNSLDSSIFRESNGLIENEIEDFFDFSVGHLMSTWVILFIFVVLFLIGGKLVLSNIGKKSE